MKTNQRIFIAGIVAIVLVCAVIGIGAMSFRGGMMRGESQQGRGVAYAQDQGDGAQGASQANDGNDGNESAQAAQPQTQRNGNNSDNGDQDYQQGNGGNQSDDRRGGGRGESFGILGAAVKLAGLALFLAVIGFGAWLLFFNKNTGNTLKRSMTSLIDDLHQRAHQSPDVPSTPSADVSKPTNAEIVILKPDENPTDSQSL